MTEYVEDQHQRAFIHWTAINRIQIEGIAASDRKIRDFIFAVPNGGKRSLEQGRRLKAAGMTAGVPDLFLHLPIRGYSGLFIEFKRPEIHGWEKGKLSLVQKNKMRDLNAAGYKAVICYGVDDAIDETVMYLYQKKPSKEGQQNGYVCKKA